MILEFDEDGVEAFIWEACSGECCLCAPNCGCCPEDGDGYLPATKEEIIARLDASWYPGYTRTMKNYLLFQYNYNYDEVRSREKHTPL